jgi:hypothetical protein
MPKQIISKNHNMHTVLKTASRQPMQKFNRQGKLLNLHNKNATIDKALNILGPKQIMPGDSSSTGRVAGLAVACFAGLGVMIEKETEPNYSFLDDEVTPEATNLNVISPSQIKPTIRQIEDGQKSFLENNDPWYQTDASPKNIKGNKYDTKSLDKKSGKLASELFCQVANFNMSIPSGRKIKHFEVDK